MIQKTMEKSKIYVINWQAFIFAHLPILRPHTEFKMPMMIGKFQIVLESVMSFRSIWNLSLHFIVNLMRGKEYSILMHKLTQKEMKMFLFQFCLWKWIQREEQKPKWKQSTISNHLNRWTLNTLTELEIKSKQIKCVLKRCIYVQM